MEIKNKIKKKYVSYDRSLMRDTRIKSNHKQIYLLFRSFAESCENVYLSYSYIAEEVGYLYSGKHEKGTPEYERAMKKFVFENLQPILDLGWIQKINKDGQSCDWEVYDHDCDRELKSSHPVNLKVHGDRELKSTPSNKNIEKEDRAENTPPKKVWQLLEKLKIPTEDPIAYQIYNSIISKIPTDVMDDYFDYLLKNKSNHKDKYKPIALTSWFYQDYLADRASKTAKNAIDVETRQETKQVLQEYDSWKKPTQDYSDILKKAREAIKKPTYEQN